MSDAVRLDSRAGVARVVLAAPGSGNALTGAMLDAIGGFVAEASSDAGCRAIVLSAEGPDFCRGLDLEAAFAAGGRPTRALFQRAVDCLSRIRRSPLPVVACVDGAAMGGGVGLAAVCDLVLASERASFMLPETIVGMIPALITPVLARRVSPARLRYLALSTRGVPAAEAHAIGLADELIEGDLESGLDRQLQRLFRSCPAALAECKAHEAAGAAPLEAELEAALDRLMRWLDRPEAVEGARAFADGMSPAWFQRYRRPRAT